MEKQKGQQPGTRERQQPFQPERQGGQAPGSGSKQEQDRRDERDQDDR